MESFKKRQKEMKRLEKAKDKAARRIQRKQDRANGVVEPQDEDVTAESAEAAETSESPDIAATTDV
jgi:hypothetical protein